ncbi:MAG: hypothetical protein Q8R15_05215 [Candidatus Micrarchaeota archaeon]|nr:hypothetical protein [Candidatus Micrarchaeota archaeon]
MSQQLFEEAKEEVVRFLLERHASADLGFLSKVRKKIQRVRIPGQEMESLLFSETPQKFKKYAETLKGDLQRFSVEENNEVDEHAIVNMAKLEQSAKERGTLIRAEQIMGRVGTKIILRPPPLNQPEEVILDLDRTRAVIRAKIRIFRALEKNGLITIVANTLLFDIGGHEKRFRKSEAINISPLQVRKLSEFLRRAAN